MNLADENENYYGPCSDIVNRVVRKVDVVVRNEGTIFLFTPLTPAAKQWIAANVQPNAQWFYIDSPRTSARNLSTSNGNPVCGTPTLIHVSSILAATLNALSLGCPPGHAVSSIAANRPNIPHRYATALVSAPGWHMCFNTSIPVNTAPVNTAPCGYRADVSCWYVHRAFMSGGSTTGTGSPALPRKDLIRGWVLRVCFLRAFSLFADLSSRYVPTFRQDKEAYRSAPASFLITRPLEVHPPSVLGTPTDSLHHSIAFLHHQEQRFAA